MAYLLRSLVLVTGLATLLAGVAHAQPASMCPDNFDVYAGTTEPVVCGCTAEAVKRGSVWGMDIYTSDSSVCRAALHAGAVGPNGGPVTVIPEPGRSAYPGSPATVCPPAITARTKAASGSTQRTSLRQLLQRRRDRQRGQA